MLEIALEVQRGSHRLTAAFEAPSPAVVAVFGPSGSGKTTLLEVVAGLLRAESARIVVDGECLCDTARGIHLPPEQRRIGYVFQDARLFPHLDVRANLRFGLSRAGASTPRIGFDEVVSLLALEALLARRPHTLSGGERQRVAIGRALLSQPRLLLLDEPLSALDAGRREEVLPYIEGLRDRWQLPMLYVSHRYDEVLRLATQLVLLESGKVTASGPLQALALHPALREAVGEYAAGAIIESRVSSVDAGTGLCRIPAGAGELRVAGSGQRVGAAVRVQILARDIILAIAEPRGLSVRNVLRGEISAIDAEGTHARLVAVDIGGEQLLARITREAEEELGLVPGKRVWCLVKAVSMQALAR
ncbi:MAG: molybdenum ABC transporter ATP-binding protein [Gammaproteobacteria bacterium]